MNDNVPKTAGTYIVYVANRIFLVNLSGIYPMFVIKVVLDFNEFQKGRIVKATNDELKSLNILDFGSTKVFWLPLFGGLEIPKVTETRNLLAYKEVINSEHYISIWCERIKELVDKGVSMYFAQSEMIMKYGWTIEQAQLMFNLCIKRLP